MNASEDPTPVVLVGGRSRRFGADKLLTPLPDGRPMVQAPIDALRAVFGPRVLIVGDCDPRVVDCADGRIDDPYPGVGPIGGVRAALEATDGDVFVVPGDLPRLTAEVCDSLRRRNKTTPREIMAVLARTERLQPCVGVYRLHAAAMLASSMREGKNRLHDAIPLSGRVEVDVDAGALINVNRPDDLPTRDA